MTNAYESRCMQEATGETLRPGGFKLTEKAVEFCALHEQSRVLDLGCGMGATIKYLDANYSIRATGIDPSVKLLKIAQEKNPFGTFILGKGDALAFEKEHFDCVFAECTLSLMDQLHTTLDEVHRVLSQNGWFVITDVYAKNPKAINALENFSINSCMRGVHDLPSLQEDLKKVGFEIMLVDECSHYLKELMVKIIFSHGSMDAFWRKSVEDQTPQQCCSFGASLKACKPGYFMIIAKKIGATNG